MSLKHGLLGLLNYGQMTGYELNKAFKESLNLFWQAQTSQIYRELNAMENMGWLTSEIILQTDKPNKRLYSITEKGQKEFQLWLEKEDIDKEFYIKSTFLMKLFFSGERSVEENIKTLIQYKSNCQKALHYIVLNGGSTEYYSNLINDKQKPIYWTATANFGKLYFEMCIKWADETIGALNNINKIGE